MAQKLLMLRMLGVGANETINVRWLLLASCKNQQRRQQQRFEKVHIRGAPISERRTKDPCGTDARVSLTEAFEVIGRSIVVNIYICPSTSSQNCGKTTKTNVFRSEKGGSEEALSDHVPGEWRSCNAGNSGPRGEKPTWY